MATTPRDRLDRELEKVRNHADGGNITADCRDRLLEYADALDDETISNKYRDRNGNVKTMSARTVEAYLRNLRIVAVGGFDLLDCDADAVNDEMDRIHDHEDKSKSTLAAYQSAAQAFYRYHDDLGVDADDINIFSEKSDPKHDERDMFEESDVRALRRACGQSGMPVRNRALLELLIFTGQRIRALLTLRIKDVDAQDGYIYLNEDADRAGGGGLKGATRRGRKRPIFGAAKYVRDWLDYHPKGDDPDAWLFVGDPSHHKTDPDDHWAEVSADHVLRRLGEAAGVDKPVNAHNFRHYCATVLYRDYDVDKDTIRMLFGHTKTSTTLEETYSHLFDDDYIQKAEEKLGYRERESKSPLTPDTCPTCGEILEDHWRQCPACQEVFGPSDDFEEQLDEVSDGARDEAMDSLDAEEVAAFKAIVKSVDDPAALAEHLADLDA